MLRDAGQGLGASGFGVMQGHGDDGGSLANNGGGDGLCIFPACLRITALHLIAYLNLADWLGAAVRHLDRRGDL